MSLQPGSKLGPYEISGALGAGGMGEVYRAHDTRLKRDVALKVLPEAVAADGERLARFEREARLLAALNHPHIAAIYGLEESGETPALVMELVEGPTLADRLARGPIPVEDALPIALQIAEGLEYAHERGIIHRDLKPANIKLTADDQVKILDFGLAKAMDTEGSGTAVDLSHSPTMAYQATERGLILGTAAYMSPEQARGRALDKRTDIWAFGVVLYEMLTGEQLFGEGSVVDTLSAVMRKEIELGRLPEETPGTIRWLLARCLERNPKQRLRDIGDARIALGDSPESSFEPAGPAPSPSIARKKPFLIPLVGVACALLGAALGVLLLKRTGAVTQPEFRQLTFQRGTISAARFTPDGDTIVYSAAWDGRPSEIFATRRSGRDSRAVGLADASLLAVSSQEELAVKLHPIIWANLFQGTLARVPVAGGTPREVKDNVQEADWSPDGRKLFVVQVDNQSRWLVESPEGKVLYAESNGHVTGMRISPDGRRVAIMGAYWGGAPYPIRILDESGKQTVLGRVSATGIAWAPSGKEIWYSQRDPGGASSLWAVDLAGRKRLLLRQAGSLTLRDIARDGTLLVSVDRRQASVYFRPAGASQERDLAWSDGTLVSDISNDGKTLLFNSLRSWQDREGGFYLRNGGNSPPVRLGSGRAMALSPDGKWVLVWPGGQKALWLVPTGAGETRTIPLTEIAGQGWFFPGGDRLLVNFHLSQGPARLVSMSLEGGDVKQLAPDGWDNYIGEVPLSPDGKWLDSQNGKLGHIELKLFPTDGSQQPRDVSGFEPGDAVIRWTADGRALYVYKRDELPARVYRLDLATGARTLWLKLMPADPAGVIRIPSLVLTPDGRSYAYNVARQLSDLYLVRGVH